MAAEFAYNNAKQAFTGMSPFYLVTGQNPLTPIGLIRPIEKSSNVQSNSEFIATLSELMKKVLQLDPACFSG